MPNTPTPNHPLRSNEYIFRPDQATQPPDPAFITRDLVITAGMTFRVLEVFADWNGVEGLTMLYGECLETGKRTHLSPIEIGGLALNEPVTVIKRMERLPSSVNGNPSWRMHLTSGQIFDTAPDLSESLAIGEFVERRTITDLEVDSKGRLISWRIK